MGLYGNDLLAFSEQFRELSYFDQVPAIDDGYTTYTPIGTIRLLVQNDESGVKDSNGHVVKFTSYKAWSLDLDRMVDGKFTIFQSQVYRIMIDNDWPSEDGFYQYRLEKLVGSNGVNTTNVPASDGGNKFA